MHCCGANKSDDETSEAGVCKIDQDRLKDDLPFIWRPTIQNTKKIAYIRQLECRYERLQLAYFNLRAEMARLEACLRQIVQADGCERAKLISEVKCKGWQKAVCNVFPTLEQCNAEMGNLQSNQQLLIRSLRQQIGSFVKATKSLETEEELLAEQNEEAKNIFKSLTSVKTSQSETVKEKEAASAKITKYADELQTEMPTTSQKTELFQLKSNTKLTSKVAKATKKQDAKKVSSSENVRK